MQIHFTEIFVAIDKQTSEVIGATTLLVEQKFIHSGGKAGHIEDVVTRKGFEGLGIGSALINQCITFCEDSWLLQSRIGLFRH